MNIQHLIEKSEKIVEVRFGVAIEKSSYKVYEDSAWAEFLRETGSDSDSHGIYLPRTLSAHLKEHSQFLPVNLLHEYFGHGLFCEHSAIGQRIVSLERRLEETEKKILGLQELPSRNHYKVDETSPFFEEYKTQREEFQQFFYQNIHNYEGFAMWLEHFLAKETGQEPLFLHKMEKLIHPEYRNLLEAFHRFSENKGNFALIAQLGFPKYYDDDTVVGTLRRMYEEDFQTIRLGILYGSKKPYSDIDLFLVSDRIESARNHWLDVYAVSPEEFEHGLKMLSIAVTDPLFSGRTIIGDPAYHEQLKNRILKQPITQNAINYNIQKSEEQKEIALMYPEGSKERDIALSYERSFKSNAEALREGKKILTLKCTD